MSLLELRLTWTCHESFNEKLTDRHTNTLTDGQTDIFVSRNSDADLKFANVFYYA